MAESIEVRFDVAMMRIYQRALAEVGYRATRFHNMLCDHGGLETARILLHSSEVSDGYVALWKRGRLDLTVEALILDAEWSTLFSNAEREIARQRLHEYGYPETETNESG